jgi:BirA family biotin operon repressor/biotin-[acetyl-CoA-carboxylase] ligase
VSERWAQLGSGLPTRWLGRPHEHHASIDSTNERALAWAAQGAGHGALVTADRQTAGRGRRGRTWDSPAGVSLHATVVLRPTSTQPVAALGLAVAVGLREGLPVPVRLKWPNDLLVGGRKLGGILCEARWVDGAPQIAAGFGINLRVRPWPAELEGRATSLEEAGVDVSDALALAVTVLASLESALDEYLAGGFGAIRARYLPHCTALGQRVRIGDAEDPDASELVTAVDLDEDGALLVRPRPGAGLRRVEAADVWLADR